MKKDKNNYNLFKKYVNILLVNIEEIMDTID